MTFILECDREVDGRWLAEVPELPGVLACGVSADEAMIGLCQLGRRRGRVLLLRGLPVRRLDDPGR